LCDYSGKRGSTWLRSIPIYTAKFYDIYGDMDCNPMNRSTCDLLMHNGQIITMDSERRIYRQGAVAVNGSRIKAGVTAEDEAAATVMGGLEMLRSSFTMFSPRRQVRRSSSWD